MNKTQTSMWFMHAILMTFTIVVLVSCNSATTPTNVVETPTIEGIECCMPASTSIPSSPFHFEFVSNEVMTSPGEVAALPLTISHEIPSMEAINIVLAPASGQSWRFALCYEDLCFASDGQKTITRNLGLKSGNILQIEIKYFIPDTAKSAEIMTLELRAESGESPLINTSTLMTAKIK